MAEFLSMRDWLRAVDAPHASVVTCDEEPPAQPSADEDDDDAFEAFCSELRRFRAALLDALACASEGERAELRMRCGTIDAGIELDARHLCERVR